MKKLFTLIFAFIFSITSYSQYLNEATYIRTISLEEIQADFTPLALYSVDLYRVLYNSTDLQGNQVEVSGLISLPSNGENQYPMVIVQHGTVDNATTVPSNQSGGYELGVVFSSFGFVATQADLLGLGVHEGIHPYVHDSSTAWVGLDLMRAARELDEESDQININDQVFVTGYSQGGHGAMAAHRSMELEHSEEFNVVASAPMSGPYSVSDVMIDFALGDEEYFFSAYLISVSLALKEGHPDLLADYDIDNMFKEEYHADIEEYKNDVIGLFDLNERLEARLLQDYGTILSKNMLLPDALEGISTEGHPLHEALELQDNYNWAPSAPTRLYYCGQDEQVSFENALLAEQVMNENGAASVVSMNMGETLDHGGCVTPAVTNALLWFLGFQNISTSVDGLQQEVVSIIVGSNVVDDIVSVSIPNDYNVGSSLVITSSNGNRMNFISNPEQRIDVDVSHYNSGMYFVSLYNRGELIKTEKIMVF